MVWSIWAFIITLVIAFFSMGLVGAIVHLLVSPILRFKYPPMSQWSGDWVWPANIIASLAWSAGFLIAGIIHYFLKDTIIYSLYLKIIYFAVLWVWALIVWWVILMFNYKD